MLTVTLGFAPLLWSIFCLSITGNDSCVIAVPFPVIPSPAATGEAVPKPVTCDFQPALKAETADGLPFSFAGECPTRDSGHTF